ncbi:hypothetical protein D3P08_20125 [Paenibacillus nanensis]|uniref:Peptidase M28 domain-containing protein n=1 Tax=Paenibacillus nanensis TaxID=393251 RepID=A0A3A1UT29_9BACL|nr:M28 family metallopeptidase [Paenibacillus nanensis]RIX50581.1 hypothetical protein D3P08_20125 [Paenibacillus nanensis]
MLSIWIAAMTFLFLLISCQVTSSQNPYELLIDCLTDDEFEGRLTGTEGNAKAQAWIEKQFKTIGLEPFHNDSYAIPYEHEFYNPDKQKISLEVIYSDQERYTFKYGADFLDQAHHFQFDETAQLAFSSDDPELSQKVLVLANGQDLVKLPANKPKAVLLKSERFKKIPPRGSAESAMPILQISSQLYERLIHDKEEIDEVKIVMEMESENIQSSNVIGKISSKDDVPNEAIIISAHFDSVGWAADTSFNGALDNTTGVSMMLQLANLLNIHFANHPIGADLIFAAFNGEETGLQGSRAFADQIANLYESLYVINLDSIGGKNKGQTLISVWNGSNPLALSMEQFLNDNQLPAKLADGAVSSDHLPFAEQSIQAITISDEDLSLLHTSSDENDVLDYAHMEKMVTALFNFLTEGTHLPNVFNDETTPSQDAMVSENSHDEFKKILDEAKQYQKKLELGQYLAFIESVNQKKFITKRLDYTYYEIADIENRINGLKIPNQVDGIPFESAAVAINDFGEQIKLDAEVGKIYSIAEINASDINNMSLYYVDQEGYGVSFNIYPMQPGQNEKDFRSASNDTIIEDYTYNGRNYTQHYLSDIDESLFVSFSVQLNNQQYFITVYEVKKNGEQYATISKASEKEKFVEKVDKLPWKDLIEDMGLGSRKSK